MKKLLYISLAAFITSCGTSKKPSPSDSAVTGESSTVVDNDKMNKEPGKTNNVNPDGSLNRSVRPTPGPTPVVTMKEPATFTTANGIKVFVLEDHKIPKVNLLMQFDFLPPLEKNKTGLSEFIGDMAMSGTKTKTKDEINKIIDGYGATVSFGNSSIYASSLTRHFENVLDITSDILLNTKPSTKELKLLKDQSIASLETLKDDPDGLITTAKATTLYGTGHPYGEIATKESYTAITVEDCKKYMKDYFRPNNAYLAIVGDVTVDQAKKWVDKFFSDWKEEKIPTTEYTMNPMPKDRQVVFTSKTGAVQSNFNITYPVDLKQDNPDVLKTSVTTYMLGGGSSSKLFKNLRETHGWTYGSYANLSPNQLMSNFTAYAKTRNEVTDSAIQEAFNEMENMRNGNFSDEDLRSAANFLKGSFSRSLESPRNLAMYAIQIERYGLPKDYYKNYLKNIDAISKMDVQNTAKKYFHPDQAYIIVSGNKTDVLENLKKFDSDGNIVEVDYLGREVEKSATVPTDKTGAQVIQDYIDATGGKQAWNNVKNIYIKAEAEIQGMTLSIEEWRKPGKRREEVSIMGNTQSLSVVNGDKAWEVAGDKVIAIEGDDLNAQINDADFQLELKYADKGYKLHLDGIEKVNGSDAYVVTVTSPQGENHVDFFDMKTGFKVKSVMSQEMQGQVISQIIEFADYKEVSGGLYLPFTQKISFGPQSIDAKVKSVKINEDISDDLFNVGQ